MPLDPNIILGIKPSSVPQVADPMEQYGKRLALKNLLAQSDDDESVRNAYQQAGGDNTRLRALLQGGGQYKQLQALDKFDLEKREKEAGIDAHKAAANKSNFEAEIGQIQHGSSILSTAKDQPSWDMARRVMSVTFPKIASQLPEQYDPAFVQAKLAAGQTLVQKLSDQRAAQTIAETGRHNAATEKNAAGQLVETNRHNTFSEQNPPLQHIEGPDGLLAFNPRGGAVTSILGADGKPVQSAKPLTESQGKATGMAMRAQAAHDILNDLAAGGTKTPGIVKMGAENIPLVGGALGMGVNSLPTWAGGPNSNQQRVEQAQRDFVNAALRVESGASINQSEFQNAAKQYFTQPGDSPATIEQKRQNREKEIESLKVQAGTGAKNVVAAKKPVEAPVDVAKLSDDELLRGLGIKKK